MCHRLLPLASFHADRRVRSGLQRRCKHCKNAASYESRRRHDPPSNSYRARRGINIATRFGITHDDYDQLLAAQGGVCAICQKPETRRLSGDRETSRLAIDHCDELGVRGLLCLRCNVGLGHFRDNPDLLDAAATYLRQAAQRSSS